MTLWNIFIIEEAHLRQFASKTFTESDSTCMIRYGMPSRFLQFMNLAVVTDRFDKQTMTVVKNRWMNPDLPWTMPGTYDLKHLDDLINYVQEFEVRYVANELA